MSLEINRGILTTLETYKNTQSQTCASCPIQKSQSCPSALINDALEELKKQYAQSTDLFYKLEGVMHFVDKWLEGSELQHHPVNRANMMRDKVLKIIEEKDKLIKTLEKQNELLNCQKNNALRLLAATNK